MWRFFISVIAGATYDHQDFDLPRPRPLKNMHFNLKIYLYSWERSRNCELIYSSNGPVILLLHQRALYAFLHTSVFEVQIILRLSDNKFVSSMLFKMHVSPQLVCSARKATKKMTPVLLAPNDWWKKKCKFAMILYFAPPRRTVGISGSRFVSHL